MKQNLLSHATKVSETDYNLPSLSIILPFEPKMQSKSELTSSLQSVVEKVEKKIFDNFYIDMALLVIQKLKYIIKNLDFSTHKKSIAIYVSPVFEKVLYLNVEVDERIVLDKSFHIQDLIKNKKELHQYLLLQLTEKECRIYVNESGEIQKIFFSRLENFLEYADPLYHRLKIKDCDRECVNINIEKFLRRIDNSLDYIMDSYHLPLFVIGNEEVLNHFNNVTNHAILIIENIISDYQEGDTEEIKKIMVPYIADWNGVKQRYLLNELHTAAFKHKLATGIPDVIKAVMEHRCRILLLEENYQYPELNTRNEAAVYKANKLYNRFSYLKDTVDEIIEKILEEDGDVEFVSKDIMEQYDHIALIIHSKKNIIYENNYPGD